MPNLFAGVSLALQSLLSHQAAVEVIEHNVANVNTPGYRRQEAVLKAGPAYSNQGAAYAMALGQLGTGVSVDSIRRFSTEFYDTRYRYEIQNAKQYGIQSEILSQLEGELAETSSDSLVNKLDAFWGAWQRLSVDPSNSALKADALDIADALVKGINSRGLMIHNMQMEQDNGIIQRVDEINQAAGQVAQLNAEISRVISLNEQPNDLMDQRDALLDRLAELTGATTSFQPSGEVVVSVNGHVLVQDHHNFNLVTASDPATGFLNIYWEDGKQMIPRSGEMAGILDSRDNVMADQLANLDTLANSLIARVNTLHSSGFASGKVVTTSTIASTVTGFGAGVLDTGQTELANGNTFIETMFSGTAWQFRVVDGAGVTISVQLSDGSGYSNGWQDIPAGTGSPINYDTGRGLTVTFGADPTQYAAASFGSGAAQAVFTQQQDLFTGSGAIGIRVNATILNNANLLAVSTLPNAAGDGTLANQIANVRTEKLLNGGLSSINEFYSLKTAEFGNSVKQAVSNAKDRGTVADVVNNQRLSIAGVNLNEEAANLVKAQKAFEAAARLMTVVDEMLDKVINGMGIVGR